MSKLHTLANLGAYQPAVDAALSEMEKQHIVSRIWAHDHTVWKPEPTEITNRLGWLHVADAMLDALPRLEDLVAAVQADGYTNVLLLGMGGPVWRRNCSARCLGARAWS